MTYACVVLGKCLIHVNLFEPFLPYLRDHLSNGDDGCPSYTELMLVHVIVSFVSLLLSNSSVVSIVLVVIMSSLEDRPALLLPYTLVTIHASSSCFASPIGYHTNIMVSGIGNYNMKDFLKLGLPLHIISSALFPFLIYRQFTA